MRLKGQTAIVTGAGRGIGRAIAIALAKEGAEVVVCARTTSDIEAVVTEIQRGGGTGLAITADVTKAHDVDVLITRTKTELGHIDMLVNSAGGTPAEVYPPDGSSPVAPTLWEFSEATWDGMIASNLKSVFLCVKAVMPHMISRKHGEIVNIVSQMGRVPTPYGGP